MSRQRIRALRTDSRGQTVQDFAVGISVFLLTTAFVFGLVPELFSPYEDDVTEGEQAQAARTAELIVSNYSVTGRPNVLNESSFNDLHGMTESELHDQFGLPKTADLNVTVRTANGTRVKTNATGAPMTAGKRYYEDRPAASATRIVAFDDGTCDPEQACRLVVKVW